MSNYTPDEMLDRAVLDNQGREIGVIKSMLKVREPTKDSPLLLEFQCRKNSELKL